MMIVNRFRNYIFAASTSITSPLTINADSRKQSPSGIDRVNEKQNCKLGSTAKKFVGHVRSFVRSWSHVCVRVAVQPFSCIPSVSLKTLMTKTKYRISNHAQRAQSSDAGSISTPLTPPTMLSGIQGPLSSLVAPCRASARLRVWTSKSVTYDLPSGNFVRTSNSWSSIMSSFHSLLWPSYTHKTRFFIFILSVGQPQDTG